MRDPYDLEIATGVSVRDGQIYLVDCPQDALPAEPRDDELPPAVPPVSGGDDGEHIKSRKDLRKEALSLAHQAFHKPMNPECEYCGRGKKRHVASHSGRTRFPETFGEIITFDQVSMKDVWKLAGVGNFPYNLPIFDLGTGFRMSDPLSCLLYTSDAADE